MTIAKMTLPRPVAAIDAERKNVEKERAAFEKRVAPDNVAARKAYEQRREAVIAYQVDGDEKAGKRLEALTQRSDAAARTERDNADCIEELTKRLQALNGDRLVAVRDELQAARTRSANQQLVLSKEIDGDVAALVEKCGRWLEFSLEQYQICADLNEPISRTPRQQLGWVIHEAFGRLAPTQFERPALRGATFKLLAERFATDPAPAAETEGRKTA